MNAPVSLGTFENTRSPYEWLGRVLTNFALAEQSIAQLCVGLGLPIEKGSLSSLADLRKRLCASGEQRCKALDNRIGRWSSNRPVRHLLAHATLHCMIDPAGREVVITRHLPRDRDDVTPDRMWLPEEREEILRQTTHDSRSIPDQVRNILRDRAVVNTLRNVQPL